MCGFLGWFKAIAKPISEAGLQLATSSLAAILHRGPDDGGEASGDGWWMDMQEMVDGWRSFTTGEFQMELVRGNHLFVYDNAVRDSWFETITDVLTGEGF
jgi:glutamate synthase domain-containing protein 1